MRSQSSSSKYASNLYYFTFVPLSSCSFKYMLSKSILIGSGFRPSRPLVPLDNNVKSSYWNLGRKIRKRRIFTHEICGGTLTLIIDFQKHQSITKLLSSIQIDKSCYSDQFFLALTFSWYILTQCGLTLSCIPQHSQNTLGVTK